MLVSACRKIVSPLTAALCGFLFALRIRIYGDRPLLLFLSPSAAIALLRLFSPPPPPPHLPCSPFFTRERAWYEPLRVWMICFLPLPISSNLPSSSSPSTCFWFYIFAKRRGGERVFVTLEMMEFWNFGNSRARKILLFMGAKVRKVWEMKE